ncbi:MAG TPA: FGGY-family carbohydrate kinase, partial [Chthoniobacterales bacterium]|nr:FGGY-family carbohydrate kinase [Chthoniobacterales bacterium]
TLVVATVDRPDPDPAIANLLCITGGWAAFAIVDATGDAIRWARTLFQGGESGYSDLIALAEDVPAVSEGVLFLPYLNGERIARKPNSRGQFFGLTSRHTVGHLNRAILEGVAFACNRQMRLFRQKGYRFDRVIAAGGGAKSSLWLRIKASIYNCPIVIPSEPECGVVGCAMLAGVASGLFADLEIEAARQVRYTGEIEPNPEWTERYAAAQRLFDDIYESSERFWDRLERCRVP